MVACLIHGAMHGSLSKKDGGGGGGGGMSFGLDFQAASDGPVVAEAGGFVPSKRSQQTVQVPPDGFSTARSASGEFNIGSGGLVSSKAVQDNAAAAQSRGLPAAQLGLAEQPKSNLARWAATPPTPLPPTVTAQ